MCDKIDLDRTAAIVANISGRNPESFRRFAWRKDQLLLDDSLVWRAVETLAAELLFGLRAAATGWIPDAVYEFTLPRSA